MIHPSVMLFFSLVFHIFSDSDSSSSFLQLGFFVLPIFFFLWRESRCNNKREQRTLLGYVGFCILLNNVTDAHSDTCDTTLCVCVVLSPICLWYFLQQYRNTLIFLQFGSWFIKCLFIFFAFGMELKLARPFSCLNKRNFSVNNISSHKCIFVLPLMSEQNEGWYLWGKQNQTKSLSENQQREHKPLGFCKTFKNKRLRLSHLTFPVRAWQV